MWFVKREVLVLIKKTKKVKKGPNHHNLEDWIHKEENFESNQPIRLGRLTDQRTVIRKEVEINTPNYYLNTYLMILQLSSRLYFKHHSQWGEKEYQGVILIVLPFLNLVKLEYEFVVKNKKKKLGRWKPLEL